MKKLIAVMTALMILVCGCTAAFAKTKAIDKEEAMKIALEDAGLKEKEVKFTKVHKDRDDGRVIWEIEFVHKGIEYEYDIDAKTGRILEADTDRYDGDDDWDDFFDFD